MQEPNNEALWNKIKYNSVTPFLMGLWRMGAFGPGSPEQVFTVKVDAENNPPANIQQGILTVEVYFYPSRPAETIITTVGQQEGGGNRRRKWIRRGTMAALSFKEAYRTHEFVVEIEGIESPNITKVSGLTGRRGGGN